MRHPHKWEEMLPEEFYEEFNRAPIAYWGCGAMEEHGLQNALGTDPYTAYEICLRAVEISASLRTQRLSDRASIEVNVPHGDLLIKLLHSAGVQGKLVKTGGTMKVIDFCRTMRKLFPYFRERLTGWMCLDLNLSVRWGQMESPNPMNPVRDL